MVCIGAADGAAERKYAKEINVDNLELNVWNFNKQAISFYEHMGFTVQKSTMEIKL